MSQSPAPRRIRPVRWILGSLLTLGLTVVGLPGTSASAAADGVVTGTVTFHEASPTRTVQVFVQGADGTWTADTSRTATVADNGAYAAHVPGGVPVRLRVSFGSPSYGYWYGDVFSVDVATTVKAASGTTRRGVDLDVPMPVAYSGRLVDRSGTSVTGSVIPTVNTDGASLPIVDAPIPVDASGVFSVLLPTRASGVYEGGVMGTSESGNEWAWLDGGTGWEPDFYLNPRPGDSFTGKLIELPLGRATSSPSTSRPAIVHLRATRAPVVRGVVRKGHRLYSTRGAYTVRPAVLRFQWLRNGKAIRGATHASYRLRRADVRKHIRVRVTAFRSGTKVRVVSPRTTAVRAR